MSEHNITVPGGTSVRLPTSGKYCDRDIIVTAEGGGSGETAIDLTTELTEQESIIAQIKAALEDKASGESSTTTSLGAKMYSFGVLSDIHLRWGTGGPGTSNYNFKNGIDDFRKAIPVLQNLGAEFVCISGDIGYDSKVEELSELYKPIIDELATVPFYACTGNHDYSHTDAIWQEYVGHPLNHEFVKDGDVFLFMSLVQTSSTAEQATPYSTSLTWLKERLTIHKGSRIFVFMHYPITGYAGLRVGTSYGFSDTSDEDATLLKALINTDNCIVFSGHTHYKFAVESDYPDINVVDFPNKDVALVHVPSSAYPRNSSHSEEPDLSEGYIVDVYENAVILRGVNLVTGEYMNEDGEFLYVYELSNSNDPVAVENGSIVLSTNSISLKSNETAQVEISLTNPINATVTIEESNDYISVSPTTLTFTEDNYNVPQIVEVTATNIDASGFATITVSSDGLTSRTISVSLTHEEPEVTVKPIPAGQTAPTNDEIYGGACGSATATYQLTDSKTVGNYNFTFSNLELTSNQTALYFGATDANSTTGKTGTAVKITLKGNNSIDVTSGNKGQRVISSSGTSENYLIGVNDAEGNMATLTLKGTTVTGASALIKGYWIIENAVVTAIGTMDSTTGGINVVADGMVLHKNGTFSLGTSEATLATVQLLPCDNGYLDVKLGAAKAGATALTVTASAKDGYTLTAIKVNGVEESIGVALTMPVTGETLTIQGVFAN